MITPQTGPTAASTPTDPNAAASGDASLAIHEAFRAIRRQLVDYVQRKRHA